ncbi:hypothetical protein [Microbacterium sp. KUDC0406]|uniref:hypothetical protein n=1 Tax=Microbacterium sp. KUDC0406 TaxID=2909588 RepID=UPI003FA56475
MPEKRGRRVLRWVLWSLLAVVVLIVGGTLIWSQVGVMAAEPGPLAEAEQNPGLTIDDDTAEGIVLSPRTAAPTWAWCSSPARRCSRRRTSRSCRTSPQRTASPS